MIALLARPDDYVCRWRNGELYIVTEPRGEDRKNAATKPERRGEAESSRRQPAHLTLA